MISVSKLCSYYFPFNKEEVLDKLVAKGKGTKEEILAEWERKRDYGIAIHEKIHKYLISKKHGTKSLGTEGIESYINCVNWLESHDYEYYSSEVDCKCHELEIRGRIDAIFKKDDHFLIVDWKSSTNDFPGNFCEKPLNNFRQNKHDTHLYQLKIQEYLLFKKFGKPSALAYVVPANDENFTIYNTELDRELVKNSVENFKSQL